MSCVSGRANNAVAISCWMSVCVGSSTPCSPCCWQAVVFRLAEMRRWDITSSDGEGECGVGPYRISHPSLVGLTALFIINVFHAHSCHSMFAIYMPICQYSLIIYIHRFTFCSPHCCNSARTPVFIRHGKLPFLIRAPLISLTDKSSQSTAFVAICLAPLFHLCVHCGRVSLGVISSSLYCVLLRLTQSLSLTHLFQPVYARYRISLLD